MGQHFLIQCLANQSTLSFHEPSSRPTHLKGATTVWWKFPKNARLQLGSVGPWIKKGAGARKLCSGSGFWVLVAAATVVVVVVVVVAGVVVVVVAVFVLVVSCSCFVLFSVVLSLLLTLQKY